MEKIPRETALFRVRLLGELTTSVYLSRLSGASARPLGVDQEKNPILHDQRGLAAQLDHPSNAMIKKLNPATVSRAFQLAQQARPR